MKKVFFAGLFLAASAFLAFGQNGVLKEISGTVELKHRGVDGYVAASVGDRLAQDTIISTGLRSAALVEVGSTVISLRPLTRLTLTEIQAAQGEEKLNVNLSTGRIKVDVNPPAGAKASMAVSSPQSTASVRGTSFYFDTRNLTVESGTVVFKGNRGYTLQVEAGGSSLIGWNNNATSPQYSGSQRPGEIAALAPSSPAGVDSSGRDLGGRVPAVVAPSEPPSEPGTPNTPSGPGGSGPRPPDRPPPGTPDPPVVIGPGY